MLSCLSVNINGFSLDLKKRWIKGIVCDNKIKIFCIQETHLQKMHLGLIKSIWGGFNFEFDWVESVGPLGGILLIWDNSTYQSINCIKNNYFMAVIGVWKSSKKPGGIINVYGCMPLKTKVVKLVSSVNWRI